MDEKKTASSLIIYQITQFTPKLVVNSLTLTTYWILNNAFMKAVSDCLKLAMWSH
ncbi:hypothetical protein Vc3S01_A0093 [Vibrio campbellii]|nr:hypothetical protein Vc3S01_A0093 [Vibrio campbellii]